VFRTSDDTKTAELPVGDEPVSVVIHPDDNTAFVALRADAKVVKITNIRTTPALGSSVNVGSEPTGIALTPTGAKLVVAEFAESRVALIDTATMTLSTTKNIVNPRAVAVSNDGDTDDNDEKIVVTEFYGRPTGTEAGDASRTGVVQLLSSANLTDQGEVQFPPVSPGAFVPTSTAPNQLASVAIAGDKFYVTAVGASPDGIATFNENVFPLVLIGSVSSGTKLGTISLADAIKTQVPTGRNFMADVYDLAFVGNSLAYILARGADEITRTLFTSDSAVTLGATVGGTPVPQIDLLANAASTGCQNPIGVVTAHNVSTTAKMYVDCWVSRAVTVVDLNQQKAIAKIASSSAPAGAEASVNKGRRFYFTGRARWSNESWSSCGSCHPDGWSDNITWRFPTGPRQSISMDGTFSHGAGTQKERILNFTAERDEVHDFERNTRAVSGGLGAITTGTCGGDLSGETRLSFNPNDATDPNGLKVQVGAPSIQEIQDGVVTGPSCVADWEDINNFVKTIRPAKARKTLDAASVDRGLTLFRQGGCAQCHGGAGWTLSRRFDTPLSATNVALAAAAFTDPGAAPKHTKQIEAEPTATAGVFVAPPQVSCVLRRVGSFGIPGDTAATDSLERKGAAGFPRAQGEFAGYNIPSLYGLSVAGPLLHHGQAKTLDELFGDVRFTPHRLAGSPIFNNGNPLAGQELSDLKSYLFSIDANKTEESVPGGSDLCPTVFP
jgi:cytochrome c peroxidase